MTVSFSHDLYIVVAIVSLARLADAAYPAKHEDRLRTDDLELDLKRHKAVRSGVPLNLTPKEFLLLAHLVRRVQQQNSGWNCFKISRPLGTNAKRALLPLCSPDAHRKSVQDARA
jgi:hypothetical protein